MVSIVSPSICHEVMGLDAMILVFWMLSFKPAFSLSSFTFLRRLIHKGGSRWQSRRMCAHLLWELQNCNLLLNNHWQVNVGSHQKKMPHIQRQRRSPNKMVGGAKSCLESSPIPTRDAWRAPMKPCAHQGPEIPQGLSQTCLWMSECLMRRHGSAVVCRGDRGAGFSRPGKHSMWHKSSWRRSPLAPP